MRYRMAYAFLIIAWGCNSFASDVDEKSAGLLQGEQSISRANQPIVRELNGASYGMTLMNSTDLQESLVFNLRINHNEVKGDILKALSKDNNHYENLLKYCAFEIQNDLMLITDLGDSVPCSFSHFERSYGIVPGLNFQTAFAKPKSDFRSVTIVLDDIIFDQGKVKIYFENVK